MSSSKSNSKNAIANANLTDSAEHQDVNVDRLEGVLHKYTNVMKGWQFRWFVVDAQRGVLEYYIVISIAVITEKSI
jgi:hypothetical protein